MAWHEKGDKPLSELLLTKISNAVWHHKATIIEGTARIPISPIEYMYDIEVLQ